MSSIRSINRNVTKNKMKDFYKNVNSPDKLTQFCEEVSRESNLKWREAQIKILENDKKFFLAMIQLLMSYTLISEGYGRKRLNHVMKRFVSNVDSFNTGHLTKDDYPAIQEEVLQRGIKIDLVNGGIEFDV